MTFFLCRRHTAALSFCLLMILMGAGRACADDFMPAGPFTLSSGSPVSLPFSARINETVQVQTTSISFGTIGIHQVTGSKATLRIAPDGQLTDSHGGTDARIVTESGSVGVHAATVDIQGAFPGTVIYAHYENIVDLTCGSGTCTDVTLRQRGVSSTYSAPTLLITEIQDDLDHLGNSGEHGAGLSAGSWQSGGTSVDGQGRTDSQGQLTFSIGATISTDGASQYYASGMYNGSFDMTLSY